MCILTRKFTTAIFGTALLAGGAIAAQGPANTPLISGVGAAEFFIGSGAASVAFYRDVLGLEVAMPRGGGAAPAAREGGAAPAPPPASTAGRSTGTVTGIPRIVRLGVPGSTWRIELIEMTNVAPKPTNARRQDVGASGLILYVRDIGVTLAALRQANARIVTVGGQPLPIGGPKSKSRGLVAQDPDGMILDIRQLDPLPPTDALSTSNVIGAGMTVTIKNTEDTVRYWHEILDFDLQPEKNFSRDATTLARFGTPGGQVRTTLARHPNSQLQWELLEFKGTDGRELLPSVQGPGTGAVILLSQDMPGLVTRLKASSATKILSIGGDYVPRGNGGGVIFFQELNGFILEGCKGC